ITIYGQQELVKDLIAARLAAGGAIEFESEEVSLADLDSGRPRVRFRPAGVLSVYERSYPFAWLGILAAVAPSTDELIYARHPRGFALHSLRSPEVSRLYIQVDPTDDAAAWPDERVWDELRLRLAG